MINRLDRDLRRLLDGSGAQVAVLLTARPEAPAGSVISTCPLGFVAPGSPWPRIGDTTPGGILRDPAALANLIPVTVQPLLPAAPTAALPLALADPGLSLLLIWCDSPAGRTLTEDLRRLVDEEIAYIARILEQQRRSDREIQRLQAMVGELKQGVVSVDDNQGTAAVNPAAARLLRLTPGEVRVTDFTAALTELEARRFHHPESASVGALLLADPAADIDCTWRFAHDPTYVQVSSHAVRAGAFPGRVWVFDDVTRTSEALGARLLADNLGEVACHIREGRFVLMSGPVERVLGAPAAHWIGREAREIIPAAELPGYATWRQILIDDGEIKKRVQVINVDGVAQLIHLHARPFHDINGRVDGAAVTFRLIDDAEAAALREAAEARRQQARSDERYRQSMEHAAIGMCLITPDGRFAEVNNALCQLFDYDAETLKQKTWQELTAPEYLAADQRNVNEVLQGRLNTYRMVKQYVRADGHRIWGDLSVSCVRDQDGQVEHFISQITDITAAVEFDNRNRVLAQRLQQQSNRLTAELQSAAAYMSSVMPRGLTGKVAVSSRYLPSQELGGDCFDYTWIDDNHLMFYLIDVSGHGIAPALLSVSLHNMLRSGSFSAETLLAPDAVLAELNRLFQMDQQGHHYFTAWYGVYDASSRTLRYSSAGAPPALAFNSTAGKPWEATELSTHSAPVGMFEDTVFTSRTYPVPPGCRILVYSDGLSEIALAGNRLLTPTDFRNLATRLVGSPDWSLDDLIEGLRTLAPGGVFNDDCSLIQLEFD